MGLRYVTWKPLVGSKATATMRAVIEQPSVRSQVVEHLAKRATTLAHAHASLVSPTTTNTSMLSGSAQVATEEQPWQTVLDCFSVRHNTSFKKYRPLEADSILCSLTLNF